MPSTVDTAWTSELSDCIRDVVMMRPADPIATLASLLADPTLRPNWTEEAQAYAGRNKIADVVTAALEAADIVPDKPQPNALARLSAKLLAAQPPSKPADGRAAPVDKEAKKLAVAAEVNALLEAAGKLGAKMRTEAAGVRRPTAVVLTGGPGVGKTTLIDHVKAVLNCPMVPEAALQAIDVLNKAAGKDGQKAWRTKNAGAFGDLVGRIAMAQEADALKGGDGSGVVLFDRTVLDNLGYSLNRGYDVPGYLTAEVAATAVSHIDHVLVLDQVASIEAIEKRNQETGRKTDPKASVAMSSALEEVYTKLGCKVTRIPAGTVEDRGKVLLKACGLG